MVIVYSIICLDLAQVVGKSLVTDKNRGKSVANYLQFVDNIMMISCCGRYNVT